MSLWNHKIYRYDIVHIISDVANHIPIKLVKYLDLIGDDFSTKGIEKLVCIVGKAIKVIIFLFIIKYFIFNKIYFHYLFILAMLRKVYEIVDSEEDKDIESNLIYLSYVFDLIATISESNPYLLELYIKEINSIIEHPIIKSKIDYNSIANNLKSILMNT